jgi:predicted secreted hydrolase
MEPVSNKRQHPEEAEPDALKKQKTERQSVQDETINKEEVLAHLYKQHPDWPALTGDIDLAVHDLPHDSSDTEWWYINAHVKTESGQQYSVFAAFFRMVSDVNESNTNVHLHAITWAIVDVDKKTYTSDVLLDKQGPSIIQKKLDGYTRVDGRLKKAMQEVVERGHIPLPDRLFEHDVKVSKDSLNLDYDGNLFVKNNETGEYHVTLVASEKQIGAKLNFTLKKNVIRHGHDGLTQIGRHGDEMFYYFVPRCDVTGSVTVCGVEHQVSGNGWYDHEFGGKSFGGFPGYLLCPFVCFG